MIYKARNRNANLKRTAQIWNYDVLGSPAHSCQAWAARWSIVTFCVSVNRVSGYRDPAVHTLQKLQLSNVQVPWYQRHPDALTGSCFIPGQFALMISPGAFGPPPSAPRASRCSRGAVMQRGAGRARCHLLPSLLRRAPRFAVLLFFRLKAWTLNAVFSGNRLHDEPENLLRRSARVSGGRGASHLSPDEAPRRVVSWAWFVAAHRVLFPVSADGLRARGGGAAVPHVLATHLHPRAPPAPAGLLLVSEPPPHPPLRARPFPRAR